MHLKSFSVRPLTLALTEPFGIATGAQAVAENLLVRVELEDGTRGYGEAAPFPAVNGETVAHARAALEATCPSLLGLAASVSVADGVRFDGVAHEPLFGAAKSALCALETAVLDAACRQQGVSLWHWFGAAQTSLVSDLTIVTGGRAHAQKSAVSAAKRGFSKLKVKVGAAPLADDVSRLLAIVEVCPEAELTIDANAAYTPIEALDVLRAMGPAASHVVLLEQPTPTADITALAEVRSRLRAEQVLAHVLVAADESASTLVGVERLIDADAVDVINFKITKSGLSETLRMVARTRQAGLEMMIGGMVEGPLCMTTSACLAAGLGGFRFVDLDTPLFMDPEALESAGLAGGFRVDPPRLFLDGLSAGHGVEIVPP